MIENKVYIYNFFFHNRLLSKKRIYYNIYFFDLRYTETVMFFYDIIRYIDKIVYVLLKKKGCYIRWGSLRGININLQLCL